MPSRALVGVASAAQTCSSRVDLPMPGSPPINSAEPGTKPPPVTRSNSLLPLTKRGAACDLPFRPVKRSDEAPMPPARVPPLPASEPGRGFSTSSSTRVFQSLQASHLPDHLLETAPQDWQT